MTATPFWHDKQVIVTGGAGFLGSYVAAELQARGAGGGSYLAVVAEEPVSDEIRCRVRSGSL